MDVGAWTLALEIGGTTLAAGLVRPDGSIGTQESISTRGTGPAEALFAALIVHQVIFRVLTRVVENRDLEDKGLVDKVRDIFG